MKKVKWLVIVIIMIYTGIWTMDMFSKKPFRFEDYKTTDSLTIFLKKKHPIGSDATIAFKDLELAGASCHVVSDRSSLPNPEDFKQYDYIGWCDYSATLFSWPPGEHYVVRVLGDQNNSIVKFSVGKNGAFNF
jgi:hypothetical protein